MTSHLFDLSLDRLAEAEKEVRVQLIEAQLREWPDSLILTHGEMLKRWLVFDKVPFMQTREEWLADPYNIWPGETDMLRSREYGIYVERTRARHMQQVLQSIAIAHQHQCVVFYECGLKDGKYQWRGARYGVEGSQYASGFGSF